jgi:hypothetical protein
MAALPHQPEIKCTIITILQSSTAPINPHRELSSTLPPHFHTQFNQSSIPNLQNHRPILASPTQRHRESPRHQDRSPATNNSTAAVLQSTTAIPEPVQSLLHLQQRRVQAPSQSTKCCCNHLDHGINSPLKPSPRIRLTVLTTITSQP